MSNVAITLKTVATQAKTIVTAIGAILAILNEVTPLVPAQWQHWVTAVVLGGTMLARDITDIDNNLTSTDNSTPSA
jgi:hypothetical protein